MNIVLIEDSKAPIFSRDLKMKFPGSCTMYVEKRSTIDSIKLIESPPTLMDKWLVIVKDGVQEPVMKYIANLGEKNINLFMSDTLNYTKIYSIVNSKIETKILNAVNVEEATSVKYSMNRLNISKDVAEYLVKICNNYMPHLEEAIIVLEGLGEDVTKSSVDKYIPRRVNLTIYSLFYHLVGIKIIGEKNLALYLYNYKYAIKYIKKKLLNLLNISQIIYRDVESGSLGSDNIEEYYNSKNLKVSKYFISKVVNEMHPTLDYPTLLVLKYRIEKTTNMITLLNLI